MTSNAEFFPLSPAQREIWLGQVQSGGGSVFTIGEALEIPGAVQSEIMERALRQLVAETEALRIRIDAARPRFAIAEQGDFALTQQDFRGREDAVAAARAWVLAEAQRPFAFDGSALFRFALVHVSEARTLLCYLFHHAIMDGLGSILVIDRLAEIYRALVVAGVPSAPKFTPYREKIALDAREAEPGSLEKARAHWRQRLAPPPPLVSLAHDPHAPAAFRPGLRSSLTLPRPTVSALCRDGTSLAQALVAALTLYLFRRTRATDIVVGIAVGSRSGRAMRNLPGLFSNIVPLRLAVREEEGFAVLCGSAGRELRSALRHQTYRIEDIERDLGSPHRAPLRRATVNVIAQRPPIDFGRGTAQPHDLSNDPTEELVVTVFDFDAAGPLRVDFIGHPDLFAPEELLGHHRAFLQLLEVLADDETRQRPIGTIASGDSMDAHGCDIAITPPSSAELAFKYWRHAGLWSSAPLSAEQELLWRLQPSGIPLLPVKLRLRCTGNLDLNRLEAALDAILRQHASLRSRLLTEDGFPRQRVEKSCDATLEIVTAVANRPGPEENTPEPAPQSGVRLRVLRTRPGECELEFLVHPLACDVSSLLKLANGFAALYRGDPPAETFDDAFLARMRRQASRRGEVSRPTSRADWETALANVPRVKLPFGRSMPSGGARGTGRLERQDLARGLVERVVRVAAESSVSPADVLLAVFGSLLSRYGGQRRFAIGLTRTAGVQADSDVIGCFEATWPFPCEIDPTATFADLLGRTAECDRAMAADREFPVNRLWSLLRREVGAEKTPPFGAAFHYLEAKPDTWRLGETVARLEQLSVGPAPTEILLCVVVTPAAISIAIEYDRARFGEPDVRRLATHFVAHLEACIENPRTPLGRLPINDAAERQRIIAGFSGGEVDVRTKRTFIDLFRDQVTASPNAVALESQDRMWTYRELDQWSDRLALRLQCAGAGPEHIVGVLFENSPEAVVAILGVLKTGAAYLPLDPANPVDRLDYMAADARLSLVVTRQALRDTITAPGCQSVCLENVAANEADSLPGEMPDIGAGHLAYVIYTSGTTGKPKGVMISHANWTHEIRWVAAHFGYAPGARVLQFSSPGFDVSAEEIGATLISGATLVCASRIEMFPGPTLVKLLADRAITHLTISPSALAACPVAELPALRKIILGGEACPRELVERWGAGARLVNGYGPTETTIIATADNPLRLAPDVSIGRPIDGYRAYVLDAAGQPTAVGIPGELHLGGAGVGRGYLGRSALTAVRFVPDAFSGVAGARLYRTGDLVRFLDDGRLEFCGRVDEQVKIRGFRIELGEIASVLRTYPNVAHAVATVVPDPAAGPQIVAYVTGEISSSALGSLREHAVKTLPPYMVPVRIAAVAEIPLTPNGKTDFAALAQQLADKAPDEAPAAAPVAEAEKPALADIEDQIRAVWSEVLGVPAPGLATSFFEAGGNSLLLVKVQERLGRNLRRDVPIVDLFKFPTIRSLAQHLGQSRAPGEAESDARSDEERPADEEASRKIAIVGMAGRFPGARNVEEFWQNLCAGREGITRFADDTLREAGVPAPLLSDGRYVKASGAINDVENFDAGFFGFSPREAALMDPQHRLFLETAWEALEHAGCDPDRYRGAIGVYAGAGMNTYRAQFGGRDLLQSGEAYLVSLGNDKDFIPTRTSYKLNLRGPSLNVNTACSSSLVAVHLARQALLSGECDMALAGGVSVLAEQKAGYLFRENGIFSPDGHCRAFGRDAKGTVPASGVGVVVLKRLDRALRDGDTIHAVVRGSAINNDGADKIGYTAPSVDGQVEVIRKALHSAGVSADQIGCVEAHGTGTELGDPIEVEALSRAFAADTRRTGYCALGSVKSSIGHVDAAAGAASLIKAALALARGQLPASLHCAEPNPEIDFSKTPFFLNHQHRPWPRTEVPRFCGVSSFGIGGTNAHVILQEPPQLARNAASRKCHLLVLSARNAAALDARATHLAGYLASGPSAPLTDVAFTLACGRRSFGSRRIVVCREPEEASALLRAPAARDDRREPGDMRPRPTAFLFPGQGSQYAGMLGGIYEEFALVRDSVDRCCEVLRTETGSDFKKLLLNRDAEAEADRIHDTDYAQPALFVTQYALAQLWMSWGVRPDALIGHSIGEITAACLAGVFSLEDALRFVAQRGRLMQRQPPGAMIAVPLAPADLLDLLADRMDLAAHNGFDRCVVAGTLPDAAWFEERMSERGVRTIRLQTSHAFHSRLMEGAVEPLVKLAGDFLLRPPRIPIVSNETASWLTASQATDPGYWGRHLRQPVRFHDGLTELLKTRSEPSVLVEVGPGRTLRSLAERHPDQTKIDAVISSLPGERDRNANSAHLAAAVGRVWLSGFPVDWEAYFKADNPQRIPLPTYPFQRERYWIDPVSNADSTLGPGRTETGQQSTADPVKGEIQNDATKFVGTETEAAMAKLWAELLGAHRITAGDNFFELGGDSLIGVQLLSRIRESFAVQLNLDALFQHPTLAELAGAVEEAVLAEIEGMKDGESDS